VAASLREVVVETPRWAWVSVVVVAVDEEATFHEEVQ
jgi:hypothetical protein